MVFNNLSTQFMHTHIHSTLICPRHSLHQPRTLAGEFEDCEFVKVDVDENQDTTAACNITNMPTFQFYKGGKKIDELVNPDASVLRSLVEKHRYGVGSEEGSGRRRGTRRRESMM